MLFSYPAILTPDDNGTIVAEFPDVPEALTFGENTEDALFMAQDALRTALDAYIQDELPIPQPSQPLPGQATVSLSPLVVAKLAIYQTKLEQNISEVEMCRRLHCDLVHLHQLLDLYQDTQIHDIESALQVLGKRMEIIILDAA